MSLKEAREKIVHLRNEMRNESVRTEWINGYIDGLDEALYAIDDSSIDEVPNRMTLRELARQPLWILKYRYITVSDFNHKGHLVMEFWEDKPTFSKVACIWDHASFIYTVDVSNLGFTLDLSEYKDENGEIDYSKCIVEVE